MPAVGSVRVTVPASNAYVPVVCNVPAPSVRLPGPRLLELEIAKHAALDARAARVAVVAGEHHGAGAALHQRRAAEIAQVGADRAALDVDAAGIPGCRRFGR